MTKLLDDILKLSVSERLTMVDAICDSIARNDGQIELSVETRQLLDERLDDHQKHPSKGSTWKDVKTRIKNQPDA